MAWVVCPEFGAASEVWLYRQATGMRRHRVRVITWNERDAEQFPAGPCEVTQVPTPFAPPGGRWRRRVRGALSLALGRPGSTRGEMAWFRAAIGQRRPSVILAQYGPTGIRIAPAAAAERIPLVVHFHGVDLSAMLRSAHYRRSLRVAIPRVTRFVVVAEYMRDALTRLGAERDRIERIPYGVPLEEFPAMARGRSPCRFLMVGRLTEKKRPDLSLRAFELVARADADAHLTIIGGGELFASVRELAAQGGLANRVTMLGSEPPQRVREAMEAADVFVQHSMVASNGDMEGWPVAIAEAAASGLPIVATRHASIPEQVAHESSGLLCDEGDWQAMGAHMLRLAADPALRCRMGQAARERIAAFDLAGQIERLERLLCDAAADSPGA
ncbi:MAG TPA: glycosyltransferase family 4 protein [Gemmatimonadales bacterium]|nr:glycosyltransferase family 4 protein [Gemmatimonadales bacterium]